MILAAIIHRSYIVLKGQLSAVSGETYIAICIRGIPVIIFPFVRIL